MGERKEKIAELLERRDIGVVIREDPLGTEMILNMGPQHPATHGVLRLVLKLDGEYIVEAIPEIGYLHRGKEKIAENMTFTEFIPHTDRMDYLAPLANNVAYILAVEKLFGIEAPPRAQFIRVIASELSRIASHLIWLGTMAMDVGAMTVFMWAFREREKLYTIFEMLTGVRFTTNYARIGGVAQDITDETIRAIEQFLEKFPSELKQCEKLLNRNRIFIERMDGIGVITREQAIDIGLSGPNLRATGVSRDLRRDEPYLIYDQVEFDIPVYDGGDCLARYYVRLDEMRESVRIVRQCLEKLPAGEVKADQPKAVFPYKDRVYSKMEELIHDFILANFGGTPPVGEVYQGVENPKGELGFYIVSDGTGNPWRLKVRSPSFTNIQALPLMLKGQMIADVVAIIGSIDPVMGEADK
jgi:NADH-quinone oxidoreductase subunit D